MPYLKGDLCLAIIPQPFLFDWHHVDSASDLDRLRLVLQVIPDADLMFRLEILRANGRDDLPGRRQRFRMQGSGRLPRSQWLL